MDIQTRTTQYTGPLTPAQQIIAWNSVVEMGFNQPFDRPLPLAYKQIANVKEPKDWRQPGMPPGAVPKQIHWGFSPPNGKAHQLITGRHPRKLTTHSLQVSLLPYADTLEIDRLEFQQDVHGLLRKIPRDLRRTEMKNPDVLLASLLRNGKTMLDYRGSENFFATGKLCSPEGAVSDTFDNLFTATALTEVNLAKVCQKMQAIKGPDGIVLGVRPDTLIIPFSLQHDAAVATMIKQIVFSTGNPAPGQAVGTAAVGDSPMAEVLKWVKKVVVLDTLQDGTSINDTTWYLADCSEEPWGLIYALGEPAEFASIMDPTNERVFWADKYAWGWRKIEGAALGIPQYIARCEA